MDTAPSRVYDPVRRPARERVGEEQSLKVERDLASFRLAGFASRAARLVKYLRAADTGGSALKMFVHANALQEIADVVTAAFIAYDVSLVMEQHASTGLKLRQGSQQAAFQAVSLLLVCGIRAGRASC